MNPALHYPPGITCATDSFKYVKLASGFGQKWIYGKPEALVTAAVTGVLTPIACCDYWSQPGEKRLASEKDKPPYDGHIPMIS